MKIYTQEQVIEVFEKYGNMSAINARNIIDLSESIELPSDEEIGLIAMSLYGMKGESKKNVNQYEAFKRGARLILNKIKGGNK